jgi:hypothetical protein
MEGADSEAHVSLRLMSALGGGDRRRECRSSGETSNRGLYGCSLWEGVVHSECCDNQLARADAAAAAAQTAAAEAGVSGEEAYTQQLQHRRSSSRK